MKTPRISQLASLAAALVCGAHFIPAIASAQEREQVEVLTRGPLHEAFAESVNRDPEPGFLIDVAPPNPIDELPPDLQPEGDAVTWIGGYWAFEEEAGDFLWVSGIWRNIPPDREWIPGYWAEAGTQFQWTSGYWEDLAEEEVVYLPKPPASVETGPNVPQPSEDHSWIPGGWIWSETRYQWRPGYWEQLREDWTYVPDCYQWTPGGYIYVAGYWDYPLQQRGTVFAPVRFQREVYGRSDYNYSPTTVISLSLIASHLFVRPTYGHYYYGDYYEPQYRDRGFFASFSYHSGSRGGYDPIYAHERWQHRSDGDWDRRCQDDFEYFRDHKESRPPRLWSNLREFSDGRRGFDGRHGDFAIAAPIKHFESEHEGEDRFRKVDASSHERLLVQRKAMSDFQRERKGHESSHASKDGKADERKEARTSSPREHRSPVSGQKTEQLSKEKAPPQRRGGGSSRSTTGGTERKTSPEARSGESKPKSESRRGESKPKSEPKTMPESEPRRGESKSESQPKSDPRRTESRPESQPKSDPRRIESNPKSQPKSQPKSDPRRTESRPESQPKSDPRRTESKPESQPKSDPRRSETRPETKPKSDPRRTETRPETKPKSDPRRTETRPETKPKSDPSRSPKVDPRRGESKQEKKPEARVEPRRSESRPEPKREVQPQRKSEPRAEAKRSEPQRSEQKSETRSESQKESGSSRESRKDDKKSKR